jgi:hypothetical protein
MSSSSIKKNNNLMSSSLMERLMKKCIVEVVESCAALYTFDSNECLLALLTWPETQKKSQSKAAKVSKSAKSFPLPFMREHVNEDGCTGIIFNHGLFTQCKNERVTEEPMCMTCSTENCGTVDARMSPDFKDRKGRRPSSYISVLRKLKLTQEDAILEAGKVNIELNELHFVEQEKVQKEKVIKVKVVKEKVIKVKVVKEVVPKEPKVKAVKVVKEKVVKEVVVKEPKVKAVKVQKEKVVKEVVVKVKAVKVVKEKAGRPKSTKKAMETVTVEDLFASLVAEEVDFCSDEEIELQTVATVSRQEQESLAAKQAKAEAELEKAEAELEKAVAKEQKKSDAKAESNERNEMHSEDVEMKKMVLAEDKAIKVAASAVEKQLKADALVKDKELKALALAEEKEAKALALAAEKEQKALALAAEKEQKALALALDKETKAAALALEKETKAAALALEKETKAAAAAEAKQLKADALAEAKASAKQEKALAKAQPKAASKAVVAAVAPKVVEEQPVKVTVKRIMIEGVEYLISAANVLYFPESREEAGLWNPVTETIEELPEESDNEEVEDDYESDTD